MREGLNFGVASPAALDSFEQAASPPQSMIEAATVEGMQPAV